MSGQSDSDGCGGCAFYIVILVGLLAFFSARSYIETQKHKKTLDLYGEEILELCVNPDEEERSESGEVGNKSLFLSADTDVKHVHPLDSYTRLLDSAQQATGPNDLTNVVCIHKGRDAIETAHYSGSYGASGVSCTRYVKVVTAYIFDSEKGTLIDAHTFRGQEPNRHCPNTMRSNSGGKTIVGKAPSDDQIVGWVSSRTP